MPTKDRDRRPMERDLPFLRKPMRLALLEPCSDRMVLLRPLWCSPWSSAQPNSLPTAIAPLPDSTGVPSSHPLVPLPPIGSSIWHRVRLRSWRSPYLFYTRHHRIMLGARRMPAKSRVSSIVDASAKRDSGMTLWTTDHITAIATTGLALSTTWMAWNKREERRHQDGSTPIPLRNRPTRSA